MIYIYVHLNYTKLIVSMYARFAKKNYLLALYLILLVFAQGVHWCQTKSGVAAPPEGHDITSPFLYKVQFIQPIDFVQLKN